MLNFAAGYFINRKSLKKYLIDTIKDTIYSIHHRIYGVSLHLIFLQVIGKTGIPSCIHIKVIQKC